MKEPFKILVPVDFSELSREALFHAGELAKRMGASVIALHVLDAMAEAPFFMEGSLPVARLERWDLRIEKEKEFAVLFEDERLRGVPVRSVFAMGNPQDEIVEKAKRLGADLILMSTHGRSGISHLLMGSVAEQVVRKSPCPVLVLNPAVLAKMGREVSP